MRGFDSPAICGDAKSTIYGTDGDRIGRMDATQRDYRVGIYTGAAHKARMAMDSVSVGRFQQSGVRGLKKADMDYMDFVSELRHELLVERKGLLVNIFGKGYSMLPADEQVGHAFDKFVGMVNRLIRKTRFIMNHVPPVSAEQSKIDRDLKAKFSLHEQMFAGMNK